MDDELKALTEENRRLANALTECNQGLSKLAGKLAVAGAMIGFPIDADVQEIRELIKQHVTTFENAKKRVANLEQELKHEKESHGS